MKAISLDDGTQLDLDTTEGLYRYVAHFLNQHGAHPEIWSALSSLYEVAKYNAVARTVQPLVGREVDHD
jgi:hypothetical protein